MKNLVVQIVTGLPPLFDGVGDYALMLAKALREQQGVQTQFLVANPDWKGSATVEGFSVIRVARRDQSAFQAALDAIGLSAPENQNTSPPLLFHCSLYGDARRALAFWIVDGLVGWRRLNRGGRLITCFHELYAFGPPWTSPFWLCPIQKYLIRRVAGASDNLLTSNHAYAAKLAALIRSDVRSILKLPVLSTVGEPDRQQLKNRREPQLVLFGRSPSRELAFTRFPRELDATCRLLKISRIVEIGPHGRERKLWCNVPVDQIGGLPAAQVSALLQESAAGFLALDSQFLGKSTVYAAYCAHGVLPVLAGRTGAIGDGLKENTHYWCPVRNGGNPPEAPSEQIAVGAYEWYVGHNAVSLAGRMADLLESPRNC